ncbi:MAG: MATE family efflux transporter [Clostridia bacterium]|nr:MATE family efflux transporter [Clostridia bacterium]
MLINRSILLPDRMFLRQALHIALPMTVQYGIVSLLNIMDVVLVQGLGDQAIAAVSLANQVNFIISLVVFGITSGATTFMAQYFGQGSDEGVRKSMALSFALVFGLTFFYSALVMAAPRAAMRVFTGDMQLVELGAQYLPVVAPTYLLSGVTLTYSSIMRCTGRAKLPMFASIIALSLNTLMNYLLIYGVGGFPKLGIMGAAVATLLSRAIETAIILLFDYVPQNRFKVKWRDFRHIDKPFTIQFFQKTTPVILNETIWGVGTAGYSMIFGRIGTTAVAAMNIASTMDQLFSVLFRGMANAALVMLGNELGAGKIMRAKLDAGRFCVWGFISGILIGVIMSLLSHRFVHLLFGGVTPETATLSVHIIYIISAYIPLRAFMSIVIVGVLRSGGDTMYAFMLDTLPIYLISLPAGILFGIILGKPMEFVLSVMYSYCIIQSIFGIRRTLSYRWAKKIVHQ